MRLINVNLRSEMPQMLCHLNGDVELSRICAELALRQYLVGQGEGCFHPSQYDLDFTSLQLRPSPVSAPLVRRLRRSF